MQSLSASAKSLAPWVQDVNTWLQKQPALSIADVISKALDMKKNMGRNDVSACLISIEMHFFICCLGCKGNHISTQEGNYPG